MAHLPVRFRMSFSRDLSSIFLACLEVYVSMHPARRYWHSSRKTWSSSMTMLARVASSSLPCKCRHWVCLQKGIYVSGLEIGGGGGVKGFY